MEKDAGAAQALQCRSTWRPYLSKIPPRAAPPNTSSHKETKQSAASRHRHCMENQKKPETKPKMQRWIDVHALHDRHCPCQSRLSQQQSRVVKESEMSQQQSRVVKESETLTTTTTTTYSCCIQASSLSYYLYYLFTFTTTLVLFLRLLQQLPLRPRRLESVRPPRQRRPLPLPPPPSPPTTTTTDKHYYQYYHCCHLYHYYLLDTTLFAHNLVGRCSAQALFCHPPSKQAFRFQGCGPLEFGQDSGFEAAHFYDYQGLKRSGVGGGGGGGAACPRGGPQPPPLLQTMFA